MEFHELQQIVESNSRAIQAMLDARASERLEHEEFKNRTDAAIAGINESIRRLTTLNEGMINMLASLDSDRPTIRKDSEHY